jgi:hypothetical protein
MYGLLGARHSIFDSIFNKGLQNQAWDESVAEVRLAEVVHYEALSEAYRLDG